MFLFHVSHRLLYPLTMMKFTFIPKIANNIIFLFRQLVAYHCILSRIILATNNIRIKHSFFSHDYGLRSWKKCQPRSSTLKYSIKILDARFQESLNNSFNFANYNSLFNTINRGLLHYTSTYSKFTNNTFFTKL